MNIAIGADHAGYELKDLVIDFLEKEGHQCFNHGTNSGESVDYPDFAHPTADDVESGKADLGIVICGSGNGINMSVNKHQAIRSALCWTSEIASLAKQHNDANMLALPARFISPTEALEIVEAFISTKFEGGRHQKRVDKISVK